MTTRARVIAAMAVAMGALTYGSQSLAILQVSNVVGSCGANGVSVSGNWSSAPDPVVSVWALVDDKKKATSGAFAATTAGTFAFQNLPVASCGARSVSLGFGLEVKVSKYLELGFVDCPPCPTVFEAQPQGEFSTLADTASKLIKDSEFATWVGSALIGPLNTPRVYQATFLFNQCFGGGFLDNLRGVLKNPGVIWIGGAASKHSQSAFGQLPVPPGGVPANAQGKRIYATPPESFWTMELKQHLNRRRRVSNGIALDTLRVSDVIENARRGDWYGTVAGPKNKLKAGEIEDGQLLYDNGAEAIRLMQNSPNGPTHRFIVLWAGLTDAPRHFQNVYNVYTRMKTTWQFTSVLRVYVLFGDGVNQVQGDNTSGKLPKGWQAATKANLQNVLTQIAGLITANDQFFFYASDHGGTSVRANGAVVPGGGGPPATLTRPMPLSPGAKEAMDREPNNTPTLVVDYTGLTGPAPVYWNGALIGSLDPLETMTELPIDEADIAESNTVEIENPNAQSFTVVEITFNSGAISDNPPNLEAGTDTCASVKLKCVGKRQAELLKCHQKAESAGSALDQKCVGKAIAKFDAPDKGCFPKAERKGNCFTHDDAETLASMVDAFVSDVVGQIDPAFPQPAVSDCSAAQKKCVAKKTLGLLKCHQKAVNTGEAMDPTCLQAAEDKFDSPATGCMQLAALHGDCLSTATAAQLTLTIDAFVDDVLGALIPTCGDGVLAGNEVCNDGNETSCDGCAATCSRPDDVCGDEIVECGEVCDPPGSVGMPAGTCNATCDGVE